MQVSLNFIRQITDLNMVLETSDPTVFILIIESVSECPEAEGSYLCLSTHHQLTQSIVDELILNLRENYNNVLVSY